MGTLEDSKPNTVVSFGSDNHSGIHPKVWEALKGANQGHTHAYGGDEWTARARKIFQNHFGPQSQTHFVFNGTAANVLALAAITKPHEAIICSDLAHLNVDEGGAPEWVAGLKLLSVPSVLGKLTAAGVEKYLIRKGDQHYRQPAVLSLTQPTEYGTVYSREELNELFSLAKKHNLLIHIDGSRLANAAHFLSCSFSELVNGADVVSFGGTKNGLFGAEAVVFLKEIPAAREFPYLRKMGMQLGSKMRFISAQFEAYLGENLWKEISAHEHAMAKRLQAGLEKLAHVKITMPVESNAVFAIFPKDLTKKLREKYFFYIWDEETRETRLMMSYDVTTHDVDQFIKLADS